MGSRKLLLGVFVWAALTLAHAQDALKIDPDNPKYLLFRGKPLLLVSASEHYGSVINRPFAYEKYLDDAAAHKVTMTRTFLLYRELQTPRNPSSPCKPESPDYIAPFERTGPGKALDGEAAYDLDKWNPEYFERLHRYLDAASKRGIVVELTIFSNTYADNVWALNPLRADNNLQHVGKVAWQEYISLKDPELVSWQSRYARKIIDETSAYDNVYYEICNEPGGDTPGHATRADVDAWQTEMARVLRDEMRKVGHPHLLSGQQAFTYAGGGRFPYDQSFSSANFDIVNDHPLPNTEFGGQTFQMGGFMSKELKLNDVRGFCRATYAQPKPVVLDEDNTASMYRDMEAWTIHRKRAWTAAMSGCHYDYIDFSVTVGSEAGTPASRAAIRTWMGHLTEFMRFFDYIHSKPADDWVATYPAHLLVSSLASGGDYVAYLADARELSDPGAGDTLSGDVSLMLPPGSYEVSLYSPLTGEYSPAISITGGGKTAMNIPPFSQDIVIRARRRDK